MVYFVGANTPDTRGLVFQHNIPVEVKSADDTKAKSLKVYIDTYSPEYAIKLSAKDFGFEDKKKTVPLYAPV